MNRNNVFLVGFMGSGKTAVYKEISPLVKSENFATSSHLLCEDTGFVWSSTIPKTAVFADTGQRSFKELAKIFGHEVESFIPENYRNSAATIGTQPPWYFYIGKEKFIARVNEYSEAYKTFNNSFDREKIEIQTSISQFIDELQPSNFDRNLLFLLCLYRL